ncbi:MAG TPA: AAA family ATPase [Alcanivoracaceae bacterium]|nr:AAA family ATPase [Alcanivoracaceae bacterium]
MKTLYIIRGLPGSGKTTLANKLAPKANACADDYFETEHGYEFDPEKLAEAHAYCLQTIRDFLAQGFTEVAVHNTFVLREHVTPYIKLAREFGYYYNIIICRSHFGNVHNVPQEVIQRMRRDFEW